MPKLDGWVQDGSKVPLVQPKGMKIAEMGLHVGIQISWSRQMWEQPEGDHQILQIGIPPHIARELAGALREAADQAEAGTGQS